MFFLTESCAEKRAEVVSMKQVIPVTTSNYSAKSISVECVVIHYTAATLARTLEIFTDPAREVSSHLVIDRDGSVYEVVQCLSGEPLTAWHAGVSKGVLPGNSGEGVVREKFNQFSIGIELVNLNGNVFGYTNAQYDALRDVCGNFIGRFPVLSDPQRFLGHEEIAGFRGKCDPGRLFEWHRFLSSLFPGTGKDFSREVICDQRTSETLGRIYAALGVEVDGATGGFTGIEKVPLGLLEGVSSTLEAAVGSGYSAAVRTLLLSQ